MDRATALDALLAAAAVAAIGLIAWYTDRQQIRLGGRRLNSDGEWIISDTAVDPRKYR